MSLHMVRASIIQPNGVITRSIIYGTAMTAAEMKSDFNRTTGSPYLALTDDLWAVVMLEKIDRVITGPHCNNMDADDLRINIHLISLKFPGRPYSYMERL